MSDFTTNYENYEFREDDFQLKKRTGFDHIDNNFASQSFWKDAFTRFVNNKGAVFALIVIVLIVIFAIIGPGMNDYTYSGQVITEQNLAPRVSWLEKFGIFDGSETISTTTGSIVKNGYTDNPDSGLSDTYYWFGSDTLGRDIWTRTWTGTRVSLYIALAAVLMVLNFTLG